MTGGTSSFELESVIGGTRTTVILRGEIDMLTAPDLEAVLRPLCAGGPSEIVLDLSNVTFVDSTALRTIISAQQLCARAGSGLSLVPGPEQVQRVFEITGMYDHFQWQDVEEPSS
jgi:anti-sigma B factor antagonist